MEKLLEELDVSPEDRNYIFDSLTKELVIVIDKKFKSYIFHSYDKLKQGSPISCILINKISSNSVESSIE